MQSIAAWNVRGMNAVSRQRDIQAFCTKHMVGMMGILEHKIKSGNQDKVYNKLCQGWGWVTNISDDPRGRIWQMWRRDIYEVSVLQTSAQLIHSKVHNQITHELCHICLCI